MVIYECDRCRVRVAAATDAFAPLPHYGEEVNLGQANYSNAHRTLLCRGCYKDWQKMTRNFMAVTKDW